MHLWTNLWYPRSSLQPKAAEPRDQVSEKLTAHKEQTGDLGDPLVGRRDRRTRRFNSVATSGDCMDNLEANAFIRAGDWKNMRSRICVAKFLAAAFEGVKQSPVSGRFTISAITLLQICENRPIRPDLTTNFHLKRKALALNSFTCPYIGRRIGARTDRLSMSCLIIMVFFRMISIVRDNTCAPL